MANALYTDNKQIPQDMLLGNLLFMNLSDMKISDTELHDIFKKTNMPEEFIRDISPADAFRRATSSFKGRKIEITDSQGNIISVKLEVDEVRTDADGIKRIIGIKNANRINETVEYDPIISVTFERDTTDVATVILGIQPPHTLQIYQAIVKEVLDKYADWAVYHNKDTVKNMINRIVQSTNPVNLMPTGLCKFIPKNHSDLLYNLRDALGEMSDNRINPNDHENICEIIPVIDTDEQRDLITNNFNAEITNDLFAFTQELKDVIQKRNVLSSRSANAYIERSNALIAKAKDYEDLLGFYDSAIHAQLEEITGLVNDNKE